jgi:proline-rich protein PRCC
LRALEKGIEKGFEGAESSEAREVNAAKEMEKAKIEVQEREARKAVTHGAAGERAAPRMNIKVKETSSRWGLWLTTVLQGAKLGSTARSRHQLSTLLNEAYQNREALEERIAEGRRNRKEAGNKYGQSPQIYIIYLY